MEAVLCASTAIAIGSPVRSPLLARQTGTPWPEPRAPIPLPLTAVPAAAVSRLRRPGLSFSDVRGHLLRARATSEDSSTTTVGQFGAASRAEAESVKETIRAKDDAETPPTAMEDVPTEEQQGFINFFDQLDLKLDSEDMYFILIYGAGAFVALWISSAIVGAIDSLPLFPKMMELVGLGFTVWFTYRYLIFKKNRDELFEKIEDLKEQIIGPPVD